MNVLFTKHRHVCPEALKAGDLCRADGGGRLWRTPMNTFGHLSASFGMLDRGSVLIVLSVEWLPDSACWDALVVSEAFGGAIGHVGADRLLEFSAP